MHSKPAKDTSLHPPSPNIIIYNNSLVEITHVELLKKYTERYKVVPTPLGINPNESCGVRVISGNLRTLCSKRKRIEHTEECRDNTS